MRTKSIRIEPANGSEPERHCIVCRQGLSRDQAREIHLVSGGRSVLHPTSENDYRTDEGDLGMHLIGPCCAVALGLAWSRPESMPGDVECTACGAMFLSGLGPELDLVICPQCWSTGGSRRAREAVAIAIATDDGLD